MTTRRKYTKEFKLDAVSLVTDQGYSRTEAASSLDINAQILGAGSKSSNQMIGRPFEAVAN